MVFLLLISALDEMPGKRRLVRSRRYVMGFTMIEVMIVIGVIAILTAIAIPLYSHFREKAQIAVAISGVKVIENAVNLYSSDNGDYPDSLADIGMNTMKDPWGNPYQYLKIYGLGKKATGKARKDHFMVPINSDFDLYSMGPDGTSSSPLTAKSSRDDIIRANDGGYVGTAEGF